MTELVFRFAGGMQALIGVGWLIAAISRLDEADGRPGDVVGWVALALGAALVAAMVVAALRVALGEEDVVGRTIALLGGSLVIGAAGAFLMAAASAG